MIHPIEAAVVRATIRVLDQHGAAHWNHSPSGETGIPDRFAVHHGRLLALEIKRPKGGKVSPKQQYWLDKLAAAGAICLIVTNAEQVHDALLEIEAQQILEAAANRLESKSCEVQEGAPALQPQPGARHQGNGVPDARPS